MAPPVNANNSGLQMGGIIIGITIAAVLLIVVMIRIAFSVVENAGQNYTHTEEIDLDSYEDVHYELPAYGETYTVVLEPGIYTVGTHIPEGTYKATAISGDYGMIEIRDSWNNIYLYANVGLKDENTEVEDLRLYQDAYFIVSTGVTVEICSENVEDWGLRSQQNDLWEAFSISDKVTVGIGIPPGVYDICYYPEYGYEYGQTVYSVPVDEREYVFHIYFDAENGVQTYHNVVLPDGAEIELEDLEQITLIPSAQIGFEKLNEFYEFY